MQKVGEKNEIYPPVSNYIYYSHSSSQVSPIALAKTSSKNGDNGNSSQLPAKKYVGDDRGVKNKNYESGLDLILSHFSEPLFPRKVSTAATNKTQQPVASRMGAMNYFKESMGADCRISAFGIGQTNPDIIFIELDRCNFATERAFKMALTATLKRISDRLGSDAHPTAIWSGHGYHIIQPIRCTIDLNDVKEFAALTDTEPNNAFLQWSERYLSANKSDNGHHAAMRSCMLRIPYSFNAKCKDEGIDPEVKIIQEWNGSRPDFRLLLGHFYAYLVGQNQERYRARFDGNMKNHIIGNGQDYGPNDWIESLLQTPIDDYRKRARDLILIPYLVIRRGMTDYDKITEIIMQWADRCAVLYRLEPTRHEYEKRIRSRVYQVMQGDRIPPMRFETLKERNPELYEKLSRGV